MEQQELDERHYKVLRAFVYRARRVECHSIAKEQAVLEAYATGRMTLELKGSEASIVQQLPDEERLESLAARVRPMLLQRELTHHANVVSALKHFAGADPSLLDAINGLKTRWHDLRPERKDLLAWSAQVMVAPGAEVETLTDVQLAYAWLYGDVVHGDQDRLAKACSFGLDERFRAATLVIGNAAQLTLWTLNLLRNMRVRGMLSIDDSYFDEVVTIESTEYRRATSVAVGEVGSAAPPLGEPRGLGWTTLAGERPSASLNSQTSPERTKRPD